MLTSRPKKWLFETQQFYIINLENVHTLKLDSCGLTELPNLSDILKLKHLSLNKNDLKKIPTNARANMVEILEVVDNPIEEVDFDRSHFPQLALLVFGSKQTKFVSFKVLNQTVKGKLGLWVPEAKRKYLVRPNWHIIGQGRKVIKHYMSCSALDVKFTIQSFNSNQWVLDKNEKMLTDFVLKPNREGSGDIEIEKIMTLMQHPSLSCVTNLILTDCRLKTLPDWTHLKCLKYADLHGNMLSLMSKDPALNSIRELNYDLNNCEELQNPIFADITDNSSHALPRSSSIEKLDISRNPINFLSLSTTYFPKLKNINVGSSALEFISFELLTKEDLTVNVMDEYKDSLIMPPRFVLDYSNHLTRYLTRPEQYLPNVNRKKVVKAMEWLVNYSDFEFTKMMLSGQKDMLKTFDETYLNSIWHGSNLRTLTSLDISQCDLDSLPDIAHLEHLKTLVATDNNFADISTLKQKHLEEIDVTGNPIENTRIVFDYCPTLKKITLGSLSTHTISLNILYRIVSHDLDVVIDARYKESVLIPPLRILDNCFSKNDIKEYIGSSIFDVSWYASRLLKSEDVLNEISQILSFEERCLKSFKMCKLADLANEMEDLTEALLKHPNLNNIDHLSFSHCGMTHIPRYKHLSKLVHVDLSGNHVENNLDIIFYTRSLSCLDLSNTGLTRIPDITDLVALVELKMCENQITSLHSLESKSLQILRVTNNPFEALNFNPARVPYLNKVEFGSGTCQFINFSVLQKTSSGEIKLQTTEDCKQNILIPPPHTLDDKEELDKYLRRKELTLSQFNTKDPKLQMKCIKWLTEDADLRYESLNLDGEIMFCLSLQLLEIEKAFFRMPNITRLIFSDCSLSAVPDIQCLTQLKVLDLKNNSIDTFENVYSTSVEEIKLVGNPIVGFDFDAKNLPNLKSLKIGSSCTRYISLQLLDYVVKNPLKVECHEYYRSFLLYPGAEYLKNKGNIRVFVQHFTLNLLSIPQNYRIEALAWILEHSASALKSLNLSYCYELEEEKRNIERIMEIFEMEKSNLVRIKHLYLRTLGLPLVLDLSPLKCLIELDYCHNKIKDIANIRLPENLEILRLEGNSISNIDMSETVLGNLRELHCGSTCNFCISFSVFEKFVRGSLKLFVVEDYLNNLLFPLPKLVTISERTTEVRVVWQQYIRYPEVFLHKLPSKELKWEALEWLLSSSGKTFTSLNFSEMDWIFDTEEREISFLINRVFSSTMNDLKDINLSLCGILDMQQLLCFSNIQTMNLSSNKLTTISGVTLDRLTNLDVSENPIEMIDFDQDCFPTLKIICFGSEQTTFVSVRVLRFFCEKNLEVKVPEDKRQYLLSPNWNVIDGGSEPIQDWMANVHFTLSHVEDDRNKLETFKWTTKQKGKHFTSVNLDNENSLFQSEDMFNLFSGHVFYNVKKVSLRSCELENIEFVSGLKQLEILDITNNQIRAIPECRNLKKLIISENNTLVNKFDALDIDLSKCPKLVEVVVGSTRLKYINFSVIKAAKINIIAPYCDNLLPLKEVLMDDAELKCYIDSPEKFLSLNKHPDAFWWLLEHSDNEFQQKLDLSNQVTTEDADLNYIPRLLSSQNISNVRTLILENCHINKLPDFSSLKLLQVLNLDNNGINDLSVLKSSSLKGISICENPILEISFEENNCPALIKVDCGSRITKFIAFDVLEAVIRKEGKLSISVIDDYKENMLIPPLEVLENIQSLKNYMESTTFSVKVFAHKINKDMAETLSLVLKREQRNLVSFDMSKQSSAYSYISPFGLQIILSQKALENIEKVYLDFCDLIEIPNMGELKQLSHLDITGNEGISFYTNVLMDTVGNSLKKLTFRECGIEKLPYIPENIESLDVSHNKLKSIAVDGGAKGLKYLNVSDNPIITLEIESLVSFPSLEMIEFGSKDIQYIGFDIIRRIFVNTDLQNKTVKGGSFKWSFVPTEQSPSVYLFPPLDALKEGNLRTFLDQPYSHLTHVKSANRGTVLIWLLTNYKGNFKNFSFNCFDSTPFQPSQYERLISEHKCLWSVKSLDLSNCNLVECPDLSSLHNLLELRLENNSLVTIHDLEKHMLQKLFVAGNPLRSVSLDMKSLDTIRIGSATTVFVGHTLLKAKLDDKLKIEVLCDYTGILRFPKYNILCDKNKLRAFLENPMQNLLNIRNPVERKEALHWALTTNQYDLSNLDLSDQKELFSNMSSEELRELLSSNCMNKLLSFSMKNCQLTKLPKFHIWKQLQTLNLSDNNLKSIEIDSGPCLLKELYISGNPLERIEIDFAHFPQLKTLECGSSETKYISIPILERVTKKDLKLHIPKDYRNALLLPAYKVIHNDKKLSKFVSNPVKYAYNIPDSRERQYIIIWLLGSRENQFSLELNEEKNMKILLDKLLKESLLIKIHKLSLSKGDLTTLPDLRHLEKLQHLDISYNKMSNINYFHLPLKLRELCIEGNPVKVINVEDNILRSWEASKIVKTLQCGSEHTKFISFRVLQSVQSQNIKINIVSEFQKNLLMPSYEVLEMHHLNDYLRHPDKYLTKRTISDQRTMEDALEWLFNEESIQFNKTFSISNPALSRIDFVSYFKDYSFRMVTEISLRNCQLSQFPSLSNCHLPSIPAYLETLDISENNLAKVPDVGKLGALEHFIIEKNPIKIIDFDLNNFPSLSHLKFGSKQTRYVKYSLLKDILQQSVSLEISDDATNLVFPGRDHTKKEDLLKLRESPEIAIEEISDITYKVEFLEWLCFEIPSFKSFRLNKHPYLLNSESETNALHILSNRKLRTVEELVLTGCNIKKFPDLELFEVLKTLDISNNSIEEIPNHMPTHKTLHTLNLSDNPTGTIESRFTYFPCLKQLVIGSESTNFVGLPLLERFVDQTEASNKSTLHITVPKHFESFLFIPPVSHFKPGNIQLLKEYLRNPEPDKLINKISDPKDKIKALNWLAKYHTVQIFSMSYQKPLCTFMEKDGLQNVMDNLRHVTKIYLSGCDLTQVPHVANLQELSLLDLSYNKISHLDDSFRHNTLSRLYLQGNPIVKISLDNFPKVVFLECGSEKTSSISHSTLKRCVMEGKSSLTIKVTERFRGALQLPTYSIIVGGPAAIDDYLNNTELDLSNIRDEHIEVHKQTINTRENPYKALRMSQASFNPEIYDNREFQRMLTQLQSVENLYLPACNLDTFPSVLCFRALTHVDLSDLVLKEDVVTNLPRGVTSLVARNCKLETLPPCYQLEKLDIRNNYLSNIMPLKIFSNLKHLLIQDNKLSVIDYDRIFFPSLEKLECGSDECQYISFL